MEFTMNFYFHKTIKLSNSRMESVTVFHTVHAESLDAIEEIV